MEHIRRIDEIVHRASTIRLSVSELCDLAGVRRNTIGRWRKGQVSPNVSTLERDLSRLERALTRAEADVLRELSSRRNRAA